MRFLLIAILLLMGCHNATPNDSEFFSAPLKDIQPTQTHKVELKLGEEDTATVELTIGVAEVDGIQEIVLLKGKVVDAGGWKIVFRGHGHPSNVGTPPNPKMAIPITLERQKSTGIRSTVNQYLWLVSADGTVRAV